MTCFVEGCNRRAKFFRPKCDRAICRVHYRKHRVKMLRQGFREMWERLPAMLNGQAIPQHVWRQGVRGFWRIRLPLGGSK